MDAKDERPSGKTEGLPPPVSELPWSSDFVMQAIEIIPVLLRDGTITYQKPGHADSLVVGWPAGRKPEEVAARALEHLGLAPLVLHSTSWRTAGEEVVLTYLAVVKPGSQPPASWETLAAGRAELARGDTTAPPTAIGVSQVLEHALRHLAWLVADDEAIARALPDWHDTLSAYVPEPFRAFGPG